MRRTISDFLARKGKRLVYISLLILPLASNGLARRVSPVEGSSSTYYVDSRSGNDTNDGRMPESAWRSLSKVNATTFRPGDFILLKAGSSWEGQIWPKGSGRERQPIHLGTYGQGAKPIVRCNGQQEDALLLMNQEYWEIEGLELTNTGNTTATRRGVHLALKNFGDAHHLIVRGMTVHDVNGRDEVKNNGGITFTSEGDQKPSRFVDVRIEDNRIYHVDRNGISSWSDRWERSKWYPSLGVIVRGNSLEDIGGDGIMIAATDGALIERNVVGRANQRSEGYNIGIWSWSADNTIIQYNEAYGTKGQRDGEGFDSDWNSRNTLIQYNYSHDNGGGFVLICNEGGHSVQENLGNAGTIVRYNISQNDRNRGFTLSGPVTHTQIYNNTIFVGEDDTMDLVLLTDWNGWPDDTEFYNNIFYAQGEARFGHGVARAKDGHHTSAPGWGGSQGTVFDANVYFGKLYAGKEMTVSGACGDEHALTIDPEFVDPGRGAQGRATLEGYALKSGSKARRSGRQLASNGGKDFWGTSLDGCTEVDRGAVRSSNCKKP